MSTRSSTKPRRTGTVGRAGLALFALVAGLALGRFAFFSADEPARPAPASVQSPAAVISGLEARVDAAPTDTAGWQALGVAYVREGTRTGDPSLYGAAGTAFDRAEALEPGAPDTLIGRGLLALTLHQFSEAERLGTLAHQADPYRDEALAVLVDATVELGRYDEAAGHLDALMALRPGLAAHSRQSYLRELRGDLPGALLALNQAETAGSGSAFDVATVVALRGDLEFKMGDLEAAEAAYDAALSLSPEATPAMIGQARVRAALGDVDEAISDLGSLTATVPNPTALVLLGELQAFDGRDGAAQETFDLVRTVTRLQEAAGSDVDLELALFEADHGSANEAIELARRAHTNRPTIFAADTLAWSLHRAGDSAPALPFVDEALRLGTADPVLHFHAAAILAATGDRDRAATELRKVVDVNPWFSFVHQAELESLAGRLGVDIPGEDR